MQPDILWQKLCQSQKFYNCLSGQLSIILWEIHVWWVPLLISKLGNSCTPGGFRCLSTCWRAAAFRNEVPLPIYEKCKLSSIGIMTAVIVVVPLFMPGMFSCPSFDCDIIGRQLYTGMKSGTRFNSVICSDKCRLCHFTVLNSRLCISLFLKVVFAISLFLKVVFAISLFLKVVFANLSSEMSSLLLKRPYIHFVLYVNISYHIVSLQFFNFWHRFALLF